MPTFEKDMIGATDAILRLQDTYDITAKEISNGIVEGKKLNFQERWPL